LFIVFQEYVALFITVQTIVISKGLEYIYITVWIPRWHTKDTY